MHYYKGMTRHGMTPWERLQARIQIDPDTDCWNSTYAPTTDGYTQVWVSGRMMTAHRLSYEHHKGMIPAGHTLDHLCRNRRCVNPDHLEAISLMTNMERRWKAQKGEDWTPPTIVRKKRKRIRS